MKLKKKQTGVIVDSIQPLIGGGGYSSLAELNEEWEDYEGPKEYWYMDYGGRIKAINDANDKEDMARKSIGNYFETKEEAEQAVGKLKAWKRIKESLIDHVLKYEFDELTEDIHANISFSVESYPSVGKDLTLLFGGEE